MTTHLTHIAYFAAALYVLSLWIKDYRVRQRVGTPLAHALPGATPAAFNLLLFAIVGSLGLLGLETGGEILLELISHQTTLPRLAILSLFAAAIVEEIIFRGYLVVTRFGTRILCLSCIGYSVLFTLLHPYMWAFEFTAGKSPWNLGRFELILNAKALYSSLFIFLNSLWLYYLRFSSWNPKRSLLPCFCAHLTGNIGVYLIKAAQGYIQ